MKNRNKNFDAELAALARKRDEDIDTSDIPEVRDWSGAVIGKFYRPAKEAVSLRIDVDVLAWLRGAGPGYQTRINDVLRNEMIAANTSGGTRRAGSSGRCRNFRYPGLERRGELQKCAEMAGSIAQRRCLFVPVQ
jgi:uncharacterized protein (DUF4415 family)